MAQAGYLANRLLNGCGFFKYTTTPATNSPSASLTDLLFGSGQKPNAFNGIGIQKRKQQALRAIRNSSEATK